MKIVIINDTSGEYHVGCNAVMKSFVDLCKKFNLEIVEKIKRKQIMAGQKIPVANVIVINGEGSLHHGGRNTEFFPKLLEEASVPIILTNSVWDSVQFLNEKVIYNMNEKIIAASVRESRSLHQLREVYKGPIEVVPDLSFWQKIPVANVKRKGTGYSDCVRRRNTIQFEGSPNFRPLVRRPIPISWEEYTTWLQGLELFVTGRFHGLCMSVATVTPYQLISSNCHKNEALHEDVVSAGGAAAYSKNAREKIEKFWEKIAGGKYGEI